MDITRQKLLPGINILHGDNAQGKTNFVEAVYFCAFGRSLRAGVDRELISFDSANAHVCAEAERGGYTFSLDAHIERQGTKSVKALQIDRVPVRHMKDLFGRLLVVMFSPEDLRLIKSGPAERRRFMDMEICQLSPVYYSDLREYHRTLRQRNALLKVLQKDKNQIDSLSIWDEQLAAHGVRVMKAREVFVKNVDALSGSIHRDITQGKENLEISYVPNILDPLKFVHTLEKSHARDIMQGATSHGIHKDDINFSISGTSARQFGSQGQQRTAALSAKLAEIEIIKQSTSELPILLLDDVFSELDGHRQRFLLEQIKEIQTIITCTGLEDVLISQNQKNYNIMRVINGKIYN